MAQARLIVATLGAALAGILVPAMTILLTGVGLVLAWMVWGWLIELACDAAAARAHGAVAAKFWSVYANVKRRARRARFPAWQRPFLLLGLPTHPPTWLRAGLCRAVHQRRERRS
jgi:hypothetical protein